MEEVFEAPSVWLGVKRVKLELSDNLKMFLVACHQSQAIFYRCCSDEGISRSHTGRNSVFLNINQRAVAYAFGQRQCLEVSLREKRFNDPRFFLVSGALKELHIGLDGDKPLLGVPDQFKSFFVFSLGPNQDIGIK